MENILENVLHLYLGCECTWESCDGNSGGTKELDGYTLNQFADNYIRNVKPLLRPLSSMTQEEMFELINSTAPDDMEDIPEIDEYDLEMFYNDGGNMVDGDVAVGCNFSCRCYEGQIAITHDGTIHYYNDNGDRERAHNLPKAYKYLLSKHFDLFGLIDAGLAIDKTKL